MNIQKIIISINYSGKQIIYTTGLLALTYFATPGVTASQSLSQNHVNFEKALSMSCEKKMQKETCKCYGEKIVRRYNEIQVVSIYKKMIEDKNAQEMFFLTTSPELLSCLKNNNQ